MRRMILAVLLLLILPTIAAAEEQPLFSAKRLSAAVGLDYVGFATTGDAAPPAPGNDWEAGVFGAYNLLAKEVVDPADGSRYHRALLSLAGSVAYGLDSEIIRTRLGVRLIMFSGGQ